MIVFALDSRVTTGFVVAAGLLLFGLLLVLTASGELRGRRKAKVPPSMRPAPGDEELERRVIERYLMWGAIATIFMALWLPAYWIREPTRMSQIRERFDNQAIERGEKEFVSLCATCHGKEAEGGLRKYVIDGVEHDYAEPPLRYIYNRYQSAGRNNDEITQLIYDAINRGRPKTPMPTWGLAFGGPLNPQQVDDIVRWIQDIQEPYPENKLESGREIFMANCAVCHNAPDPKGQFDEDDPRVFARGGVGPSLLGVMERLSREDIETTIREGRLNTERPSMPSWAVLGDDAVKALVAFIQSIQRG